MLALAGQPRKRPERQESPAAAEVRGLRDAVIVALLFQAGFRWAEAAALK